MRENRNEFLQNRLQRPRGIVDIVLDTDTYNEIDDQFALSYLIRSPEKVHVEAIYAAPFHNRKSNGPADGMEKSYREIFNVLSRNGEEYYNQYHEKVFCGSTAYLADEHSPIESAAARDLIRRAMGREEPLYVVAIGAITNIASALLLEPGLREKIVVVWLGGHSLDWDHTDEFNMKQDIAAARVVFGSGVPLVLVPCMGVASSFTTTGPELEYWLRGKNTLCDYLCNIAEAEAKGDGQGEVWSRAIWDVTAAGWLVCGEAMHDRYEPCPIPEYDHHYGIDRNRPLIRYVYGIDRDRLMADLFGKLVK